MLVDFWGTWCPPCREVIPHLIALQKKYEKEIAIVGLAYPRGPVDQDEVAVKAYADHVKEFVTANDMTYTCLIGNEQALKDVQLEGFPTLVFLDQSGKTRLKAVGYHTLEKLESIIAGIDRRKRREG